MTIFVVRSLDLKLVQIISILIWSNISKDGVFDDEIILASEEKFFFQVGYNVLN